MLEAYNTYPYAPAKKPAYEQIQDMDCILTQAKFERVALLTQAKYTILVLSLSLNL
jgi:hypothetical protein